MKMNLFNDIRRLGIAGGFAGLTFVAAFAIGSAVTIATGIPIASALVNGFIVCFLFVIAAKIIDSHLSFSLMALVYSILAIPTVLLGPPGIYKPVIGLLMGLVWDTIVYVSNKQKVGYILGGGVFVATGVILVLIFMIFLGLPGVERLKSVLLMLILASFISAIIGSWMGYLTYRKKIYKLAIIKSLHEQR